jgi:hypothetical protein
VNVTSYLPPIEKPHGLRLKLIYFFSRRQAGQVITPITGLNIGPDGLCPVPTAHSSGTTTS